MAASCLLIHYSVPKGTGNYYLLLYSHFGVPTARQHGCLQYRIPKGMLIATTFASNKLCLSE